MSHVIDRLEPLLTEARVRRMQAVLANRTDQVAFVFERMIDPHNLSAALRSLDAFSFQDIHLVHPGDRLEAQLGGEPGAEQGKPERGTVLPSTVVPGTVLPSTVVPGSGPGEPAVISRGITIGTERWLTLREWPDTPACVVGLKAAGYTVYASHLGAGESVPLTDLDFTRRTALVFGNEHLGCSDAVLAHADGNFRIDMHGFAQSLNLSVAVAVSAFHARQALGRLAAAAGDPARFALAPEYRQALYEQWLRQSVKHAERILADESPHAPQGAHGAHGADGPSGGGPAGPTAAGRG